MAHRKLPVAYASEVAECGLACLAMVSTFHGAAHTVRTLREITGSSVRGMTLRNLMESATRIHLASRAFRVEMDGLLDVTTPAILHWTHNHFVVMKRASKKGVEIHDPTKGYVFYSWPEASSRFTGVVLELHPNAEFARERRTVWPGIRAFAKLLDLRSDELTKVFLLSAGAQSAALAVPFLVQAIVDQAITSYNTWLLFILVMTLLATTLFGSIFAFLRDWASRFLGAMLAYRLSDGLLNRLSQAPLAYFEKREVGDIMLRLHSVQDIQFFLTEGVLGSLVDLAIILVSCLFIYLIDPISAAILLTSTLASLTWGFSNQARLKTLAQQEVTAHAVEQSYAYQSIRAMQTIKLYGAEEERQATWRNLYVHSLNCGLQRARVQSRVGQVQGAMLGCQLVILIGWDGWSLIHGWMSLGAMFGVIAFRQLVSDRSDTLFKQWIKHSAIGVHVERISDVPASDPSSVPVPASFEPTDGSVRFVDVSFAYSQIDTAVLSSCNFEVSDGEFVAITGKSGCGKTTMLKLILGLQVPSAGVIYLGSRRSVQYDLRAWRSSLGVVMQDDHLFSGTIAENISFFASSPDMSKVKHCAVLAQLASEIDAMPMGYYSAVGDMGATLSGGQRQRLLIARALYREPKVLILDEGTANLDIEAENRIADVISALPLTRIVVAHRTVLIERASKVLRLIDGKACVEPGRLRLTDCL